MKTQRHILYWFCALLVVATATTSHAFQMIFDDTFDTNDWFVVVAPTGGSTNGVTQDLAAGNPGACLRMVHYLPCTSTPCDTNGSPSTISVLYQFLSGAYDPGANGPIHHINLVMDRILFSIFPSGGAVGNAFRLYQGGAAYYINAEGFTNQTWQTLSVLNATANDFGNGVGGHPDFSGSGGVITFGYSRNNSNTGQGTNVVVNHGIDNFLVNIYGTNDNDLAVTKTALPDPATAGSNLTYTVVVTNNGSIVATGVTVTDALPSSVTFVSAGPSQGTCTNIGGTVVCNLGSVTNARGAVITLVGTTTIEGSITNTVTVSANEADVFPADNTDSVVTSVTSGGTDLVPLISNDTINCSNPPAGGTTCSLTGDLALKNQGVAFAQASFDFTASCKKCPATVKWKLSGLLTIGTIDLTGIPDHGIAIYLSDDANFDPGIDTLLVKKPVGLLKFAKAFSGGKPLKIKAKISAGVNLSGKFLILVEDDGDVVVETNENNNAAAFGPLP